MLAAYEGDAAASVCYIDGQWAKSPPSPPAGAARPYDRGVVVVVGGRAYVVTLGYREQLPIETPLTGP